MHKYGLILNFYINKLRSPFTGALFNEVKKMAYTFPSTWNRESRNRLQYMSDQIDKVDETIGEISVATGAIDNTSYKFGVTLEDCEINGDNGVGRIKYMSFFLGAGFPGRRFDGVDFTVGRNEMLYIDLDDNPLVLHKGTSVPNSAAAYGRGAFYSDTKILLLGNYQGGWIGAIAAHFVASAKNANQTAQSQPRLMAQKVGEDYYIYMQSKFSANRYARYKMEYKDEPYSSGAIRSNVKVHTLNQVMSVSIRASDGLISEFSEIVQSGAWDLALRESNVSDASGGIAHGDEIERDFMIMANGLEITDIPTTMTEYETLEFIAVSDVYRDTQTHYPRQDLCTHYKSYKFDSNTRDLIMDSSVKMLRDVTVNYFFLSMCSATRTYNNKALSNVDVEVQDLTQAADIHQNRPGIDKIILFGGNAPVTAELLYHSTPANTAARVSDAHYNKIYFSSALSGDELKTGDVIRAKTKFDINIRA